MNFIKRFLLKKLSRRQILARLAFLFLMYVLSIGPMFWTWHEATYLNGPKWVARVYYPLLLICHAVPIIGRWVNHYIEWWVS